MVLRPRGLHDFDSAMLDRPAIRAAARAIDSRRDSRTLGISAEARIVLHGWSMQAARTWTEITELVDHIVLACYPATRRALGAACDVARGPLATPVLAYARQLEEQMKKDETLLRAVRVLAEARAGRGPYPPPPFTMVHSEAREVRRAHARLEEIIRGIRDSARLSTPAVMRALDELTSALVRQNHLINDELLPWARHLEPETDLTPRRAHGAAGRTKHGRGISRSGDRSRLSQSAEGPRRRV